MKRGICVFLAVIMAMMTAAPIVFAHGADGDIAIVIAQNADERVKYAAQTLKDGIDGVTEKRVDIISDNEKTDAYKIIVGETAVTESKTDSLADGSYIIKGGENKIEIAGAGKRGNIYGVYRFLEEFAGYRCYSAKIGLKSYTGKLQIPDEVNIEYKPYFEYTETEWASPKNDIYSLANGLNGSGYRNLSAEQGGMVEYISGFLHTLTSEFCSSKKYFDSNPEYFALVDGNRNRDQLCLTNEDVYNVVLGEVMELLKEKHDKDAALQIVSLTQADNDNYCRCDNCAAVDEANGSPAGTMITFVNKIARAVKEAGYDNIAIDTFAYHYTVKAPAEVKPEENVIVRFCTIASCFSHAIDDSSCERNVNTLQEIKNWNKICDRIYIWDYTTNFMYTVGIFPNFGVLQRNMQIFAENGAKGVYEEGNYYMEKCDTEFGELRSYLLSRLLQNPYCDIEKEKAGFLDAFYGDGGAEVGQILSLITQNGEKQHVGIYYPMTESFSFTEDEAKAIDVLWEKAKKASENDKFALANIKRSEISWRYVKSSLELCEFAEGQDRESANKALYKDICASGMTMFKESQNGIVLKSSYKSLPAEQWEIANKNSQPLVTVYSVIYIAALVAAAVIFVLAIKYKKYVYCALLPLFGGFIEIAQWGRRAFLPDRDVTGYTITLIITIALIGFTSFLLGRLIYEKKAGRLIFTVAATVVFFILYAVPLIINVAVYNNADCDYMLKYSYILAAAYILGMLVWCAGKIQLAMRN